MIAKVRKALVAALTAFAGAVGVAYSDEVITGEEWTIIASATVVAAAGTFGVKNAEWKSPNNSVENR